MIDGDRLGPGDTLAWWPRSNAVPVRRWIVRIIVLALAGAVSYAPVDYYHRMSAAEAAGTLVSQGVSINGAPVSGLTRKQLGDRVDALVALADTQMGLTVILDGKKHTYSAKDLGITFDTAAAIQSAWTSNRPKTWGEKLRAAYGIWSPAPKHITIRWSLAKTALVPRIAKNLSDLAHRAPVDGTIVCSGLVPTIRAGINGQEASATAIAQHINQAIQRRAFSSPIKITPTVLSARQLTDNHSIVVNREAHTVTLYEGSTVLKQYPCAVGQPEYPTPVGDFHVVSKEVNPTWVNPHSSWSAGMPESIAGGPGSPLGERALALDAPAVLIHGIPASEYSSIGTDASHGCIRMMPYDILDLFGRVEVETPVFIR